VIAVAGAAAVAVAAVAVWRFTAPPAAYAALGSCADLLPETAFAAVPGTDGHALNGGPSEYDRVADPDVEESLYCSAVRREERPALLQVVVARYAAATREDDYAVPRGRVEDGRRPLAAALGGATAADGVAAGEDLVADVELRGLDAGEGGYAVSFADPRSPNPAVDGLDAWAEAHFSTANLRVAVTYRGPADMPVAAKLDVAADIARTVETQIGRTHPAA
jgi:hypothetical protein